MIVRLRFQYSMTAMCSSIIVLRFPTKEALVVSTLLQYITYIPLEPIAMVSMPRRSTYRYVIATDLDTILDQKHLPHSPNSSRERTDDQRHAYLDSCHPPTIQCCTEHTYVGCEGCEVKWLLPRRGFDDCVEDQSGRISIRVCQR